LSTLYSQEITGKLKGIWGTISQESADVLEQTVESIQTITSDVGDAINSQLVALVAEKSSDDGLEIQDKIDTIKLYVKKINSLKKEEQKASSFTLVRKSKKDYRIKIDKVLREIEPLLFDGEVVDYATKIREIREQIRSLESQKVVLNEKLVFAPIEKSLLSSSKNDIKKEITKIEQLISKAYKLIDEYEFDLKGKLNALGIEVTRAQIRVMTTRVDGDELARSFAIFDVTRQISTTLGELVKQNSFSASTTVKYYGTYVILSEILSYSQREYIRKIEKIYRPALFNIKNDIQDAIDFAEQSIKSAKSNKNKNILKSNIKSNELFLMVLKQYDDILEEQEKALGRALEITTEQITVAYSTYDTAANSANLVNLINETQDTFNRILDMQLPEIIPFENIELENKFIEISAQILKSTE
jgi:tetratricopeptide (TPR) repeat protein|tara:strand:- start:253 stop:1500 length:1248 start_codon:yes stop_codon:yes gene_type:complete